MESKIDGGGLGKQIRSNSLCSECQTGVLRLRYITYFTWLNEELVTVPNFPAWVCDICGRREYDSRAIIWLNTLLNHEAGSHRSSSHHPRGVTSRNQPRT
jgi:YgiT-type zinc finger domain-containing protein